MGSHKWSTLHLSASLDTLVPFSPTGDDSLPREMAADLQLQQFTTPDASSQNLSERVLVSPDGAFWETNPGHIPNHNVKAGIGEEEWGTLNSNYDWKMGWDCFAEEYPTSNVYLATSNVHCMEWCTWKGRKLKPEARQSKADEGMGMHQKNQQMQGCLQHGQHRVEIVMWVPGVHWRTLRGFKQTD